MTDSPKPEERTDESGDVLVSPLIAEVITASFAMTQDVSSRLIESLQYQLAEANARATAVEWGIRRLLDGPYAPSQTYILSALYPSREEIERFKEQPGE